MEDSEVLKLLIIEGLEKLDFDALCILKNYVNALADYCSLKESKQ